MIHSTQQNVTNWLVFDGEALLLLQSVHHRREEELVLDQPGQALATLVKLNLHHILISGQIQQHITDRVTKRYQHQQQLCAKPHLTNVFDARFHQSFTLKNNNKKVSLLIWCISLSGVNICFLSSSTVPQEKRSWRQSACSPGKESLQHFPSSQLSPSEDPQNLWRTIKWSCFYGLETCVCWVDDDDLAWLEKTLQTPMFSPGKDHK